MKQIQARLHENALPRVAEFFNATLLETLGEVLQNARRSGAQQVEITLGDDRSITVTDDGTGIRDPATLLSFGESEWDRDDARAERPAGMGVYSLARWRPTIQSRSPGGAPGWKVSLEERHFRGECPAEVLSDDKGPAPHGTRVRMEWPTTAPRERRHGHQWEEYAHQGTDIEVWRTRCRTKIEASVRYYPLLVRVNGEEVEQEDYLHDCDYVLEEHGLRIGVRTEPYDRTTGRGEINFHGNTIDNGGLPGRTSLDGRSWRPLVDVGTTSRIELTLPTRNQIIEGAAAEEMRESARRAILLAMAASTPPADVAWETQMEAAAKGITLPVPPPRLRIWEPTPAEHSRLRRSTETSQVDGNTLVVEAAQGRAATETLWRAVGGTPLAKRLAQPDARLAGYEWYDRLGRITSFRVEGRIGDQRFAIDGDENEVPRGRPSEMEVVIETLRGTRKETIRVDVDVAFYQDEYEVTDAGAIEVLIRKDSKATVTEIVEMMTRAYFRPSDDPESDSYDTQENEFIDEAVRSAEWLVSKRIDAVTNIVRRIAEQHIGYEVACGQKVELTLQRDERGKLTIGVKASDGTPTP